MKKYIKQILITMLCLMMVVTTFPATAKAEGADDVKIVFDLNWDSMVIPDGYCATEEERAALVATITSGEDPFKVTVTYPDGTIKKIWSNNKKTISASAMGITAYYSTGWDSYWVTDVPTVTSSIAVCNQWNIMYDETTKTLTVTAQWVPNVNYYVLLNQNLLPLHEIEKQPVKNYTYGQAGLLKIYSEISEITSAGVATVIDSDYVGGIFDSNLTGASADDTNYLNTSTTGFALKDNSGYLVLNNDEYIDWYVVKWDESDGWHFDGIVLPKEEEKDQYVEVNYFYYDTDGNVQTFTTPVQYVGLQSDTASLDAAISINTIGIYSLSIMNRDASNPDYIVYNLYYSAPEIVKEYTVCVNYYSMSGDILRSSYSGLDTDTASLDSARSITMINDYFFNNETINTSDPYTTVYNRYYERYIEVTPTPTVEITVTPTPTVEITVTPTPIVEVTPTPTVEVTPTPVIIDIPDENPPETPVTIIPPEEEIPGVLPQTGDFDMRVFYIVGGVMIAAGYVVNVKRKKNSEDLQNI